MDRTLLTSLVGGLRGVPADALQLDVRPARHGLSAPVWLVSARYLDRQGRRQRFELVVKVLDGNEAREATLYRTLLASSAVDFIPALLGVERVGASVLLLLERVRPAHRWPWAEPEHAGGVLERLSRFHASAPPGSTSGGSFSAWDYEAELEASAHATLARVEAARREGSPVSVARSLPALRRIVSAIPELRRQLLSYPPLGRAVIHGDVHPGNAMIRLTPSGAAPVLLDWARARVGSPLEDVSSWLCSLGCWEPEARRRHDTLLGRYIASRGLPRNPSRSLRDAYWLAGASNALAGALRYQLVTAGEGGKRGAVAARVAGEWLRVIRRADACWRSGAG